jgi:hypothetical protein
VLTHQFTLATINGRSSQKIQYADIATLPD